MYENITVQGIVLDTSLVKEYDKRLVILTTDLGRITVFANGARRKNSPFTACSQRFVLGSFVIRPGSQNSYTLISSEIKENFFELSFDIEKLAYASYACELAGYFTRDGIGATDELNLLYVTFKAILARRISLELIRSVFECKLMDIEGIGLQMAACVKCGDTDNLHHLSLEDGGVVADRVLNSVKKPIYISDNLKYALSFILSRDIASVYSFDIDIGTCTDLAEVMKKYLELHCDRHFKSLDILKPLE